MANPNNCATCDHSKHPDGGHCYMFREEPEVPCAKHTARLLQDETQTYDSKGLSRWLSSRLDARRVARQVAAEIAELTPDQIEGSDSTMGGMENNDGR